jgi:hypothetical protein
MKLLVGVALTILCRPLFLNAQATPTTSEMRTGCLTSGSGSGTFLLVEDLTGLQLTIVSPSLQTLKLDQKVTATGTLTRKGNVDVFEATKVEAVNVPCQIGFSADALKKSIGRARIGVRTGITLDPELITFGAQVEFGPIFRNIWMRPSTEFAFGEVTKVYSLSPEFSYYLPFIGYGPNQTRWNTYIGAGPTFSIAKKSFKDVPDQPDTISDWHSDVGLSLFVGMSQKNGMFVELKGEAYSDSPTVRLYVGYRFK